MPDVHKRLEVLGIVLPDVAPPVVEGYEPAFAPYVRAGNLVHLSGRLARENGELLCGKVGDTIDLERAKLAARNVAIELLAILNVAAGDLAHVQEIVKLFVMVNGAPDFIEPHKVADGASELLREAMGDAGIHARSAVCVAHAPFGACLEVDMIAEL